MSKLSVARLCLAALFLALVFPWPVYAAGAPPPGAPSSPGATMTHATLVEIVDGDTIDVLVDERVERVRYENAPVFVSSVVRSVRLNKAIAHKNRACYTELAPFCTSGQAFSCHRPGPWHAVQPFPAHRCDPGD